MNAHCRLLGLVALLFSGYLFASDSVTTKPDFHLWTDMSAHNHLWTVSPRVSGPPDSRLRYEIAADKSGKSGRSLTRQSGQIVTSADGSATLATLSLGVMQGDECVIDIKLFHGVEQVGDLKLQIPPG